VKKIISYYGEKYILSEETSEYFNDSSIIESIMQLRQNSKDYIIYIKNGNAVYFGQCKKYYKEDEITDKRIQDYAKEEKILKHLAEAFNLFSKLIKQHPDELNDFADGIHKCQYVIGMRYAREHRPDLFPIKEDN